MLVLLLFFLVAQGSFASRPSRENVGISDNNMQRFKRHIQEKLLERAGATSMEDANTNISDLLKQSLLPEILLEAAKEYNLDYIGAYLYEHRPQLDLSKVAMPKIGLQQLCSGNNYAFCQSNFDFFHHHTPISQLREECNTLMTKEKIDTSHAAAILLCLTNVADLDLPHRLLQTGPQSTWRNVSTTMLDEILLKAAYNNPVICAKKFFAQDEEMAFACIKQHVALKKKLTILRIERPLAFAIKAINDKAMKIMESVGDDPMVRKAVAASCSAIQSLEAINNQVITKCSSYSD